MQQRPASPNAGDGADSRRRIQQLEHEAAELRTQLATVVALVRAAWAGSQEATDQLADAVNWTGEVAVEDLEPSASTLLLSHEQKEALRRRVSQLEDLLSQEELRAAWDTQKRRVSFRPTSGNASHFGGGSGGTGASATGIRVRDLVLPASGAPVARVSPRMPAPAPPPQPPDDLFDPQSLMARANARVQSAACPPPPRPNSSIGGGRQRPRTGGPAEQRRRQQSSSSSSSIPPTPIPSGPAGVSVIGERPLKFERGGGSAVESGGFSVRNQQQPQQQRLASGRLVPSGRRRGQQQQAQQQQADRLAAEVSAAEQRGGQLESEFDRVMLDLQRKLGLDSHGLV
ncbi:hypothetical protein BOX15_Mlig031841g1 [Macrostomum lignano]|uniref:Uncharacterized protein n=1 Tax=Macrostomum lignano TaxID=282301 RepID=A0A267EZY0_9PLAT|nr:hypothetical protein BOX15_Mlig031841g1 [Macrostomum lignano]